MQIKDWLQASTDRLKAAGIGTARLDCLVLLADALDKDKSFVLAHPEVMLTKDQSAKLNRQINKRVKHVPLAYIRGKTEFYGRDFIINPDVLEPRPETETMLELLLKLAKSSKLKAESYFSVVDVGTGSGAIAVTAKLELPKSQVIAIDIDPKCLTVAKKNAQKHAVDIKFLKGDLLQPLPSTVYRIPYTLLANLPYVPDSFTLNDAAMNEPMGAIFGGADGLDTYRGLFDQIDALTQKPQLVFTESLPAQHHGLATIARNAGYHLHEKADFIQAFGKDDS